MAALGEACLHISALLFAAETHTKLAKNIACTSLPCGWLPPNLRNVVYKPISEIDFTAPKNKRKKLLNSTFSLPTSTSVSTVCMSCLMMNTVPSPTQDELACFYNSLDESGKPSLLFIVPEYCDKFVINTDLLFPLFDIII